MKIRRSSESGRAPHGRTDIHNVRFYNLQPRSIQGMAYNKIWKKLALSRNDGSIEIWDVRHVPCLERTIPKSPENSVEGLAWSADRLFSAGLSGELVEWNLQTFKPRFKQHVTGNAIWCLDVNREGSEIAIGTEEGFINIFNVENNQFQYKSLFDKQEGRVLCCRFDATGNFLVTGSMGAIRIWNTRTGHAIHKMTVTSKQHNTPNTQETIVWSLQVLQDFTIISGDSRGHVSIWDGKTASQIETHQALKADVLAVAVNEEENKLFCAGIEPTIRIYSKTQIRRDDMTFYRWVKFLQRRVHDHDVKALVCAQENIYSCGVDGYLGISSATRARSTIEKYGPFLQQPCVTVAAAERLLLLRYPNTLEIWRMGSTSGKYESRKTSENGNASAVPKLLVLNEVPEKLLVLKSKNEEAIVCSTLSPNGRWLCYSTHNEIRLFHLVPGITEGVNTRATKIVRVKDLPEQMTPGSHVYFIADSTRLMVVSPVTKQITIFAMLSASDGNILDTSISPSLDFVECIDTSKHIKDSIKLFTVSPCGLYIAAASADRSIAVWTVHMGKHYKHLLNLPRYTASTTALTIHAEQPRLVAAFADGKIIEYDLDEMCFTCSDLDRFVANSEFYCITNIVLDPRNPNIFVMQNDSKLFVLEKCKAHDKIEDAVVENSKTKSLKKARTSGHAEDSKVDCLRLKMEKTYEHLLHLCWLSPEELVAVCANPISLIEQLPNPFKEKLFRTM